MGFQGNLSKISCVSHAATAFCRWKSFALNWLLTMCLGWTDMGWWGWWGSGIWHLRKSYLETVLTVRDQQDVWRCSRILRLGTKGSLILDDPCMFGNVWQCGSRNVAGPHLLRAQFESVIRGPHNSRRSCQSWCEANESSRSAASCSVAIQSAGERSQTIDESLQILLCILDHIGRLHDYIYYILSQLILSFKSLKIKKKKRNPGRNNTVASVDSLCVPARRRSQHHGIGCWALILWKFHWDLWMDSIYGCFRK